MERPFDILKLVGVAHRARGVNDAYEVDRCPSLRVRSLELDASPVRVSRECKSLEVHFAWMDEYRVIKCISWSV